MDNRNNMLQLCRLCLVKDDVNIPIFEEHGDIRQIFLKISSCLPVKVSREDKLPKKICDGCSFKLDTLYEFCNTSANAEKQLLTWLGEAGMNSQMVDGTITAVTQQIKPTDTFVKEETIEPPDIHNEDDDDKDYMFQQKFEESASAGPSATVTSNEEEEPPPKRARRTAAVKAAIALDHDSDDDDDDSGEPMTKVEDESEESEGEDQEPSFADAPSTSADDQPGPSGVGKDGVEAPFFPDFEVEMKVDEFEYNIGNAYQKEKKVKTPEKLLSPLKKRNKEEDDEYTPPGVKKKKLPTAKERKPTKSTKKVKKQEHKIWTCRRCLEEFDSRRDLTDHTKTYHPEEPKDAPAFKFDEEQDLYICTACSAEYQTKEEVETHISKIHEEFYTCEVCKHTSKKAYSFAVHMKIHSTDDTYTCPLCNYNTPRRTCLQTHINRVHYHKFYYTCPTCGKGFNDSVIFKEHNNEHLGIKPFICVVCNKDFVYSRYMLIHQTRYHTVHIEGTLHKTQCSICMKVFSKVATLLKHITTKHSSGSMDKPEKRHLCDMCGKGFGTSDKLKIHYRIHTGDKPFACKFCEKKFTKKDYLVMHERVHTGEKPYPCEYCTKCFNQAASLRIHVRGHTGERPYVCQFCNGGYISRGSLNLHMKICNGVLA